MCFETIIRLHAKVFVDYLFVQEELLQVPKNSMPFWDYFEPCYDDMVQFIYFSSFHYSQFYQNLRDGSNILSLALVSKRTFEAFKILIGNSMVFRAKSEPYRMYSPKHVFVVNNSEIPSSATHVTLSSDYVILHKSMPNLPSSVVYFHCGQSYRLLKYRNRTKKQKTENFIFSPPKSLTSLHYLGRNSLGDLPPSLTELTSFYLPKYLPLNLTYLDVKYLTKNPSHWPITLKHLKINMSPTKFASSLHALPNLISLEFKGWCDFDFELPTSLQSLKIASEDELTIELLPPNLTSLDVDDGIGVTCPFPASLLKLKICYVEKNTTLPPQLTYLDCNTVKSTLPSSLTYLRVKNLPELYNLPQLTHLCLSKHYSNFPPNIKFLEVLRLYSNPSIFLLSTQITHLLLGKATINALPPQLEHLTLVDNYKSLLPSLPDTLLSLTLNKDFKHKLPPLPSSLKKLFFPYNSFYVHCLPQLPSSLRYLFLPATYCLPLPNIPTSLLRLQCSKNYRNTLNSVPDWCHVMHPEDELQ